MCTEGNHWERFNSNPCSAEQIKKPHPFLIFSQSNYLIQIIDIDSHTQWQKVQIQISWLLQKQTDLDLHCLQRQGISRFSRTRVKVYVTKYCTVIGRTFVTLLANSADGKLIIFFLNFPENRIWHAMQIVSIEDNLYEIQTSVLWKKKKKQYLKMSAENFTQRSKR